MLQLWSCIAVILLARMSLGVASEGKFGACQPENKSCSECYHNLKKSLLESDKNVRRLTVAFFPPDQNIPEFVTVNYCFNEDCSKNRTWFWTHDSSYLFFPLQTFQFLSLFFSKPASLFSQNVSVTLDEECYRTDHVMLTLLTQRLKNFVQRASFNPAIDDNYFARAEDQKIDFLSKPKAIYILSFYIIGLVFIVLIISILLFIYLNTKRWDKKLEHVHNVQRKNKYIQSKVFSIGLTTTVISVYAVILDSLALNTLEEGKLPIEDPYISVLPWVVFSTDAIGFILWIACWLTSFMTWVCHKRNTFDNNPNTCGAKCFNKKQYMWFALSTLGPVLSLVIHLPYIAIAYLNDVSYATSVFIYYTIALFLLFAVLDLTYGTCQDAIISARKRQNEGNQQEDCFCLCPKTEGKVRVAFIFAIPTFALLTLALAGMVTAALVIIPISSAFSDIPNRLIGFYQSAFILIGAYLIYRNFFKRKPSIESVVKKREEYIPNKQMDDNKWKELSKNERVEQFYARIINIIAKYPNDPNSESETETDTESEDEHRQFEQNGEVNA